MDYKERFIVYPKQHSIVTIKCISFLKYYRNVVLGEDIVCIQDCLESKFLYLFLLACVLLVVESTVS